MPIKENPSLRTTRHCTARAPRAALGSEFCDASPNIIFSISGVAGAVLQTALEKKKLCN